MNKKEIQDHKAVASSMDWDELAQVIMGLENERYELQEYLKKHEIKKYYTLIALYEEEKDLRLKAYGFGSAFFGFVYGQDYATSWND